MSRGQRAATVNVRENTLASQNNTFDSSTKAPKNGQKRKKKGKKTKSKKKAENSASDGAQESQEGFAVDVKDDRFSRMMEGDARFGIDPLAPEFKDTDAMRTIMGEQKKRRKKSEKGRKTKREGGIDENEDRDADQGTTVDISALTQSFPWAAAPGQRRRHAGIAADPI